MIATGLIGRTARVTVSEHVGEVIEILAAEHVGGPLEWALLAQTRAGQLITVYPYQLSLDSKS